MNTTSNQAILERLANNKPSTWKLERAIWRAGELKIREATPLLLNLIGTGEPLRDYCIAWALGWCGDRTAIPPLLEFYRNSSTPEFVSRIAFEALLKLVDEETKADLKSEMIALLPPELQNLTRATSTEVFGSFAVTYPNYLFPFLDKIYQIDNEYIRPALLDILRSVPFQVNYFRAIRHIFKIAEYRHDAEVFAILAYRFEREESNFNNDLFAYYYDKEKVHRHPDSRRVYTYELQKDEPTLAYSYQTQQYFRRRVWRALKTLGEAGDADYIKMATAVLLEYSDSDEPPVRRSHFSKWDKYTRNVKQLWDRYADYLAFNHILYSNSPRYMFNSQKWFPRKRYEATGIEPKVREEAFAELWEQHPEALLKLLLESKSSLVHNFAIKALRECQNFCDSLNINIIIKLVYKSDEVVAAFGFELALQRLNSTHSNHKLLLYLTNRIYQPQTSQVSFCVKTEETPLVNNASLIAALLTSRDKATINFVNQFFSINIFDYETAKQLSQCFTTKLLEIKSNENQKIHQNLIYCLLEHFEPQLQKLELETVINLLMHPISEVNEFGILVFLHHETRKQQFFIHEIQSLIKFLDGLVALITLKLFHQSYDKKFLHEVSKIIINHVINSVPTNRDTIKQIIKRLIKDDTTLAIQLTSNFCETLLNIENNDLVHEYILTILKECFSNYYINISKEITLKLLASSYNHIQNFGISLLEKNLINWIGELTANEISFLMNHEIWFVQLVTENVLLENKNHFRSTPQEISALICILNSNFSAPTHLIINILKTKIHEDSELLSQTPTSEIIRLANNYSKEIRNLGHQLFLFIKERLVSNAEEMLQSVNLLESKWEESREIGLQVFSEELPIGNLTPEFLVRICKSAYPEVRELGYKLVNRYCYTSTINEQKILIFLELLQSPFVDTQKFALDIFTQQFFLRKLTPNLLMQLIDTENEKVRKFGEELLTRYLQNIHLQATANPSLYIEIVLKFIELLLKQEKYQGSYNYIALKLQEHLQDWIGYINKETLFNLIEAKTSSLQGLGSLILQKNHKKFATELTTCEIVQLANNDIIFIRQIAREIFTQILGRIHNDKQEMLDALYILESKWEDTRKFGFNIFTTELNPENFTSSILIRICEASSKEARKLGEELLSRYSQSTDNEEYLLKFSEHPASDMQLVGTNYLKNNAADNPQRLQELTPYFITVLSNVNHNRTAKNKIFTFLETEAQKSEEAAQIVAAILTRQSATIAIGDKSTAIQIMMKIKQKYPQINLPIEFKPVIEERRKSIK